MRTLGEGNFIRVVDTIGRKRLRVVHGRDLIIDIAAGAYETGRLVRILLLVVFEHDLCVGIDDWRRALELGVYDDLLAFRIETQKLLSNSKHVRLTHHLVIERQRRHSSEQTTYLKTNKIKAPLFIISV